MLQRLLGWSQKAVQKYFWDLVFISVVAFYAAAFSESFDLTKHKYTSILYIQICTFSLKDKSWDMQLLFLTHFLRGTSQTQDFVFPFSLPSYH